MVILLLRCSSSFFPSGYTCCQALFSVQAKNQLLRRGLHLERWEAFQRYCHFFSVSSEARSDNLRQVNAACRHLRVLALMVPQLFRSLASCIWHLTPTAWQPAV